MSEVTVTQDDDVIVVQEDDSPSIVVILDDETEIIQTFEQGPPGPQGPKGDIGATGAQGEQGIQGEASTVPGPQGPQGPQGNQGPQGSPGNTVLYGPADPTGAQGIDGNFYINTTTHFMFGPKAAGAWPAGTSLIGPQGIQGPQGPQGNPGAGTPASALPIIDGVATVGTSTNFAREDHIHPSDVNARAVRFDAAQALTPAQQTQARSNIYAAPFDALSFNGIQVNGGHGISQNYGNLQMPIPATAAVTLTDSWRLNNGVAQPATQVLTYQQVADAPPGYSASLKITVTTAAPSPPAGAYCVMYQVIEGYRFVRLAFGNSIASPVAFGFWTKIHRPGMYSGSLRNAQSPVTRSYPFSFTQNVADTWEFKTVSISPGCVDGVWPADSNGACYVSFCLMSGGVGLGPANAWANADYVGVTGTTNGVAATTDTFQITGLIVLPGLELPSSVRAPFIQRPNDDELRLCQRYLEKSYNVDVPVGTITGAGAVGRGGSTAGTGINQYLNTLFKVPKRVAPSVSVWSPATGVAGNCSSAGGGDVPVTIATASFAATGQNGFSWFALETAGNFYPYLQFMADARM